MIKKLYPALMALLCGAALAQTTTVTVPAHQVTVPVPAVTPAAVTPPPVVLSALGQIISLQPPAVQPPTIAATTITYQEPAYTITVAPPVTPVPVVTLSADPASIQAGASSALIWAATNAISCTSAAFPVTVSATSGSLTIVPAATTSYSVSCTGVGGTGTASTTVTVTRPALTTAVIGSLAPAGSPTSIATALGTWTVPGGVVTLNGAAFGYSAGVVLLAWNGTAVYQENASCLWWVAGGTAAAPTWTASSAPTGVTLPTCTPPSTSTTTTPPPVTTPSGGAQTTVFSFPNGFANAAPTLACHWSCNLLNGDLIPGYTTQGHAAGNAGMTSTFDISGGFTVDFDFRTTAVTGSVSAPSIGCLAVVIQNELMSDHPNDGTVTNGVAYGNQIYGAGASGDANMCGFGAYNYPTQYPILHSAAVKFDMDPTNGQWTTQAFPSIPKAIGGTGLYLNGGPEAGLLPGLDMTGNGINLYLPDLFHATLAYDETNLALVLTDTVTGATYQTRWPLNLQQVVGGKNAFLTFTVGDGPGVMTQFHITAASLSTGMPTMPTAPAVAALTGISGISAGPIVPNGSASIAGSTLTLTDNQGAKMVNEAGSAWSATPVPVGTFHTSFTLQQSQGQGSGGAAFVLQNIPTATPTGNYQWIAGGPNVVGNSSGYGFSGLTGASGGQLSWIQSSVAVKFDYVANTTGMYLAGADPSQNSTALTGVTLGKNPDLVSISYDGASLVETITDTVTKAAFTHTWGVNVSAAVGGNSAYVGFTAGAYAANQTVTNWIYSN